MLSAMWRKTSLPVGSLAARHCYDTHYEATLKDKPTGARMTDWVGYGYAALIASGGVMGYVKARSVPSLAAGLLFGSLAGVGAYQISQDPTNIWVSLVTSGALAGVMGKRFYGSRKMMPAGMMAAASLLMVGKLGVGMLLQKPQES
uniref:Transmembrane protein 14C n=3 Tax=Oncorhynchus tshawytscha TaxID=74940 RepID=A0AAZ3P2F4_ONCTS